MGPLEGRAAIVTGASQGIGLEIAKAYVEAGASVMICARDGALIESRRRELERLAAPGQHVLARQADVAIPEQVDSVVSEAVEAFPQLHVLVNNAGVVGPIGPIERADVREWTRAIEINLIGSVLMCRRVVPQFRRHNYGKIIQLSGGGATSPFPHMSAYAASKAAVVRFAESLAEELRDAHVDVNALAPGAVNTRMMREVLEAGPERVGQAYYDRVLYQRDQGGAAPGRAAALAVFLGSKASDGITGKLISAIWDPWETLPDHADELRRTDVYTLRRIVPGDRGMSWGDR